MTTFNEKKAIIGTPEYDREFWNAMKGSDILTDSLLGCKDSSLGGYPLPVHANNKYSKAIEKESLMRKLATVVNAKGRWGKIWAKDCEDIAMWVPEGGTIPIYDAIDDFTRYSVDFHKLAVFVKFDSDFIHDSTFDIEEYLTERLAKNFAKAEDKGFITGNGKDMPVGILDEQNGATIAVTTDKLTFDIVQRIRDGRRRLTPMGEMPTLSGMVFCADCGSKLYQVRGRNLPQKEYMVCATYRKKGKHICTSHQIQNEVIEEQILQGIQNITSYAREKEDDFVRMIAKKSQEEINKSLASSKRELEQAQNRIAKLDTIIQKLYEDNVEGKITDERFAKMSANYEQEQSTLISRTKELKALIESETEKTANVDAFLAIVRKYTDIKELTAEVIREFVEKVYVYQTERVNGYKVQKIRIVWNCIGEFVFPPSTGETK